MKTRIALAFLVLLTVSAPALAEAGPAALAATPQLRALEGEEFERYLKALESVMALRASAERDFVENPERAQDAKVAGEYMKKAKDAMESHGFTNESFNTVHWNVMQAFAQLEIQANAEDVRATIELHREQLEDNVDALSPEQIEVAKKRIAQTEALLQGFGGVPEENLTLVETHMASLKATFEKGMAGARAGFHRKTQTRGPSALPKESKPQ